MIEAFSEFRPLVLLLAPASNLGVSFEGFNVWEEFMVAGIITRCHVPHRQPQDLHAGRLRSLPLPPSSASVAPSASNVALAPWACVPARPLVPSMRSQRSFVRRRTRQPSLRASSAVLLTANSDAAFMPKKRRGGDSKIYVGLSQRTSVAVIQVASEVTDDREKQRA